MLSFNLPSRHAARFCLTLALVLTCALLLSSGAFAQGTISTGAIVGTVTDPQGAVVRGAKVTITNLGKNQATVQATTSAGLYNSGAIVPGSYKVRVEAKGFRTSELTITVEVGAVAPGNITLQLGQESQVIEVQASAVAVNTEQATVQGVVSTEQVENLPINGRNFLDLAQLEPGVQIQDGAGFDPTKNGFSSISIGGRAGRTARIEVDGIDISDENVGTTTQNISAASIQEFQIAQSTLDLSSSLTSSGSVNVTTKSGSNTYHGSGFYDFRDKNVGFAALPGGILPYFQRNQSGGNFGGPVQKDKIFFFLNVEHSKQDFGNAVSFNTPFNLLSGSYSAPYRDTEYLGRLDWTVNNNVRAFYRLTYNDNSDLKPGTNFSPFLNRNNTPGHAIGVDFVSGTYTHSIRFGDSKFQNHISPPAEAALLNPDPALNLENGSLQTGPNSLAPQVTFQQNRQIKYDGSKPWKSHIFRFGAAYDRIVGNAFASFGQYAPTVQGAATAANITAAMSGAAPTLVAGDPNGAADNPLNYPITLIDVFNGQGYFSEKPSLGLPKGGLFDNRVEFYVGDGWKAKNNLTVSFGLHYVRDTGRTDSDLPAIPSLNNFCPGCGNKVNQPNLNLSPEVGIAWDPSRDGKTVVRLGGGIYYENNVFNNVLFDRTLRVQSGLTPWAEIPLCGTNGGSVPFPSGNVTSSDGLDIATQICGNAPSATMSGVNVGQAVVDLQKAFQSATAAAATGAANPLYVGTLGSTLAQPLLLSPNYISPRSVQLNLGFQRELKRGTVVSVDYVRNIGTHFLLATDRNHVGAARNFNQANATVAVQNTLARCGVTTVVLSYTTNCTNDPTTGNNDGGAWVPRPATMADYAANGLDTAGTFANPAAAFQGTNPAVGNGDMLQPIGRSLYSALQVSLHSNVDHPTPGIEHMNVLLSYSFSRFDNNIPIGGDLVPGDQDFGSNAVDWDKPLKYFGPAGQDRTHQLSFGPIFDLPKGLQFGMIGHIDSPLPLTLDLPQLNGGGVGGEIFRSDFTGDGTVGDVLPGTNVGSFGRSIGTTDLNTVISHYNTTYAGEVTPAGQAVIDAHLMSLADLQALNAVMPAIASAPTGNVGLGWLRSIDMRLGWTYKVKDRVTIQPSVSAFNVFNFANFDGPFNLPSGVLQGAPGTSINALTNYSFACPGGTCRTSDRTGPGSGTFSLGAPRQLEFALKISF